MNCPSLHHCFPSPSKAGIKGVHRTSGRGWQQGRNLGQRVETSRRCGDCPPGAGVSSTEWRQVCQSAAERNRGLGLEAGKHPSPSCTDAHHLQTITSSLWLHTEKVSLIITLNSSGRGTLPCGVPFSRKHLLKMSDLIST